MATDTGSPWSIPYPELDDAPDGPGNMKDLADQMALDLARAYPCTSSTQPSHAAGRMIFETDTGALRVSDGASWNLVWQDSGEVTSGFSAQSNWDNDGSFYRLLGPWAYVHIQCTRSGADLSVASNGGVSDEAIIQVPAAALNSSSSWYNGSGTYSTGGTFGFAFRLYSGTGMFQIISAMPSTTIHTGDTIYADFVERPA